jgi:hypothetical protein
MFFFSSLSSDELIFLIVFFLSGSCYAFIEYFSIIIIIIRRNGVRPCSNRSDQNLTRVLHQKLIKFHCDRNLLMVFHLGCNSLIMTSVQAEFSEFIYVILFSKLNFLLQYKYSNIFYLRSCKK